MILFPVLLFLNGLSEYLLNRMMAAMGVLDHTHRFYHILCAALRIVWIFWGAILVIPLPFLLTGLLFLLFLNVLPYPERRLMMNHFTMVIYLIYASLLMTAIGTAGLLEFDMARIAANTELRLIVMNTAFAFFNVACLFLLHSQPKFLWKQDYDKSKVVIYTRFLFVCSAYHILDSIILTIYPAGRISYLLLVSGDILIFFLMFNFLNYNYVFAKSEELRRQYEESEVLIAQRYFEKESLKKISEVDSLTNAYNRREICSIMAGHIQNGLRLICVFIDLDGLKRANDLYGHTFGDLMLKRFADTCAGMMQGDGYLARIGGDEFLLVFPDGEISRIEALVRNLQLKLLETADPKDKIFFSYGISSNEDSVDRYMETADQQMYADKNRKQRGSLWTETN